jgi:mannose-6-phosphate isomerase-like protein (cupin superfamily)
MNELERPPDRTPTAFSYSKPPSGKNPKQVVTLGRTDRILANVQVLREGGENNLHSHPHLDGFWMVLQGRVRFYGDDDVVLGEFGPHEGIIIPRNSRYWFESVSDEPLEILQVEAFERPFNDLRSLMKDRVNVTEMKGATLDSVDAAVIINARRP